jgi:hypothetical protein
MTKKELADLLGLKPRQIDNLVIEGMPRTKRGRAYVYGEQAVAWYYQRKEQASEQRPDVLSSQARREAAKADLAELDLAEKRGQLVRIADVCKDYGAMLERLRGKLLNAPGKYAPRIVGIRTLAQARAVLEDLVRELMVELHSDYVKDDSRPSPRRRKPRRRTRRR